MTVGFLYIHHGAEVAKGLFVTGYALEKVLSVDNLFVMMGPSSPGSPFRIVIATVFFYFGDHYAIVFRGIFVAIGIEPVESGAVC